MLRLCRWPALRVGGSCRHATTAPRPAVAGYRWRGMLGAGSAEDFFFDVGDAGHQLVALGVAVFCFDCVDLAVQGDDLIFGCHFLPDVADILRHGREALLNETSKRV